MRSIEHGSVPDDEAIELMVRNGTFLVADLHDGDYILEHGPGLGYGDEVLRKTEMTTDVQRVGFTRAIRAGVKIAYGTDAGVYPHGNNARQLSYYVDHGLSPTQAIQSTTRWPSELMGWKDSVGSLSPGTYADLVIVEGNPLDDITLLEDVGGVMKGGEGSGWSSHTTSGDHSGDGSWMGNLTVIVVPLPGVDWAVTSPPISSTNPETMERPSPLPSFLNCRCRPT